MLNERVHEGKYDEVAGAARSEENIHHRTLLHVVVNRLHRPLGNQARDFRHKPPQNEHRQLLFGMRIESDRKTLPTAKNTSSTAHIDPWETRPGIFDMNRFKMCSRWSVECMLKST